MTLEETGILLAKIALIENRNFTNESIQVWFKILEDVSLEFAMEALMQHYRNSTEPVKPAHIYKGSKTVKEERKKRMY